MAQTLDRPGVYITETVAPAQTGANINLSNAVFLGVTGRGPVGAPTTTDTYSDFTRLFGAFTPGKTPSMLEYAVWQYFNNGGRQAIVVRALVGDEATASVTLLNREATTPQQALVVSAANPGAWGNDVLVAITDSLTFGATVSDRFDLTVYYRGTTAANVVEKWSDLSLTLGDPRYTLDVLNDPISGSAFVRAARPFPLPVYTSTVTSDLIPAATVTAGNVVPTPLTAGANTVTGPVAATYSNAFAQVDQVTQPLGINIPDVTDAPTVNNLLAYCANRGDAFAVIDGVTKGTGTAKMATDQVTLTSSYTRTSYGACYYPRAVFADPASTGPNARVTLPVGGSVLGLYAATDVSLGIFATAAGRDARVSGAVALETLLSTTDLALLNKNGVNAVRNIPGSGVVLYGGRTIKGGGTADKYIAVRRSLIYIKSSVNSLIQPYVFQPNRPITWQQIRNVLNQFLLNYWNEGGLIGDTPDQAFYVVCDESNNTTASISSGVLNINVGVATVTPAEFVAINITQYDGAVTVTDSAA